MQHNEIQSFPLNAFRGPLVLRKVLIMPRRPSGSFSFEIFLPSFLHWPSAVLYYDMLVGSSTLVQGRPFTADFLIFKNIFKMGCRSYAEMAVYTIELRALGMLKPFARNCWGPLSDGLLRLEKPDVLSRRVEKLGERVKAQHPMAIIAKEQKKVEEEVSRWEVTRSLGKDVEAHEEQKSESASGQLRCSL